MGQHDQRSAAFREALWVSRCVGRAETTPLRPEDVEELASFIRVRTLAAGEPLGRVGDQPEAVHIVRDGCLELAVTERRADSSSRPCGRATSTATSSCCWVSRCRTRPERTPAPPA